MTQYSSAFNAGTQTDCTRARCLALKHRLWKSCTEQLQYQLQSSVTQLTNCALRTWPADICVLPQKLRKQDMKDSASLHWDLLYIRTSCKAKHVRQKAFEETPVSAQLPRQIAELRQCGGLLLISLAEAWLPTAAAELCWSSQLSSPATSHTPIGCVRVSEV